ncbi:MAG: rhomboid family protein [Verrucomicrobiota bacterium]|jgi:hypothetical protein
MQTLAEQRCFNHSYREAVARCPSCTRFFCRECITEHDDRLLCAVCLRKTAGERSALRVRWVWLVRFSQTLAGLVVIWLVFYAVGQALLALPSEFHNGSIWKETLFVE